MYSKHSALERGILRIIRNNDVARGEKNKVVRNCACYGKISKESVKFRAKNNHGNSAVVVYILHSTPNLVISRCCFLENGQEMYNDLKRSGRAIGQLNKPFVR